MNDFILAIDQGTTGTTALAVDTNLQILSKTNVEFKQYYPKFGWVEHSADDIYLSIEKAVNSCLQQANLSAKNIIAFAIANQRETTCLFDTEQKTPHPFIVWQCKRSDNICSDLKKRNLQDYFKSKTGLVIDPYFSATKLVWLFQHYPELRKKALKGKIKFGTIDSWLTYRLTDGQNHVTDATNASRTLMMNIHQNCWDEEILDLLKIPINCLPKIVNSSGIIGRTKNVRFLPDGIPIAALVGDQQAALFGQACFNQGQAKITFGTGAFLLVNTGSQLINSKHGLLTSIAAKVGNTTSYCLEGTAFIAGAAVTWLKDKIQIIDHASEIEALALQVTNSQSTIFVPAFAGLAAPHWNPKALALFKGISMDTSKAHLARAVLEGIAMQNVDIIKAMIKDGISLTSIKVDGGASSNNLLMQMQADFMQIDCIRPQIIETTAFGAACLAALGVGIISEPKDILKSWQSDRVFTPSIDKNLALSQFDLWQNAVNCA